MTTTEKTVSKKATAKKSTTKKAPAQKKKAEPRGRASKGVKWEIFQALQKAPKTGISKDEILDKLTKLFPDRKPESMKATIGVQVPGKMSKQRDVQIIRLESGKYVIVKK